MNSFNRTFPEPLNHLGTRIALLIVSVVLAVLFLSVGAAKLLHPTVAENFARHGLPDWFRVLLGSAEIAGGLMLLRRRTGTHGACVLTIVLVGVICTHLMVGGDRSLIPSFVVLGLVVMTGSARGVEAWGVARARYLVILEQYAQREIANHQHQRLLMEHR